MEWSTRLVTVLLLRHGASVATEFSENRDRLFALTVDPINTYAVFAKGVFRNLEHIGWSGVVKFHRQRIRRKDVVSDVAAPLSGDVFACHCVGDVCCTGGKQDCNQCKPSIFHDTLEAGARSRRYFMTSQSTWKLYRVQSPLPAALVSRKRGRVWSSARRADP
jgi:hypothetical protein